MQCQVPRSRSSVALSGQLSAEISCEQGGMRGWSRVAGEHEFVCSAGVVVAHPCQASAAMPRPTFTQASPAPTRSRPLMQTQPSATLNSGHRHREGREPELRCSGCWRTQRRVVLCSTGELRESDRLRSLILHGAGGRVSDAAFTAPRRAGRRR